MRKAPSGNGAGADHNAGSVEGIITDSNPCPHAPDCRTRWIADDVTETADCAHCFQTLNRAELTRLLDGTL